MNELQKLESRIRRDFPSAEMSMDKPARATGIWWLDIAKAGSVLHVAWSKKNGFGISSPDPSAFGAGHDEVMSDLKSALERVGQLLRTGERTSPRIMSRLKQIREESNLSQTDLARKLKINQAAVSKLENREDMRISTLSAVVAALGGKLEIKARFSGKTVQLFSDSEVKSKRASSNRKRRKQIGNIRNI